MERIIHDLSDIAEGADWLAQSDPRMALALSMVDELPLRRQPDGFGALLDAIVGQQVSIASARAIRLRMQEAGYWAQEPIAAASEDDLRAAGLSRQKAKYAKGLAMAALDYDALRHAPSHEVIKTLTALSGIGQWTAEIYAMFALGRADQFAHGDLALQEATRSLYDLPHRPNEREMRQIAKAWAPWRAVAARILWAYYRLQKNREGVIG